MLRRQLPAAVGMLLAFTLLTGLIYPLAVTAAAHAAFSDKANGSVIERDGHPVGSRLLGQAFTEPGYFHPRPSAAGDGYDAAASAGTNLGPTNPAFLAEVRRRVAAYRDENNLASTDEVPVDAVTSSASGLDPDISVANARLQAPRVADTRHLAIDAVLELIAAHTDDRALGFLGEDGVNVLELNLALDALGSV